MRWGFPDVHFERHVDDVVVHCVDETQAYHVLGAGQGRLGQVGVELHPEKTRIVYYKDSNRAGGYGCT